MRRISIEELHQDTGEWVRLAANCERIIIIDDGQPVAALTAVETLPPSKHLPDREKKIGERSSVNVDSADYISEMRG